MPAGRIITLTTDFGLTDAYVAAMKGVILSIMPEAQIVDVSHGVTPQHIREAGLLVDSVLPFFPDGTVHVVVVDPGVGTARLPVALQVPGAYLVGPDNGVLPASTASLGAVDMSSGRLSADAVAVEIRNPEFMARTVSTTFHGRDIFAPTAAHILSGVPLSELGPRVERLQTLPLPAPTMEDTSIRGEIVHVDHFGNLITNIPGNVIPASLAVEIVDQEIRGLARTYQEQELAALVGSSGYLEIARRNGSAAELLGAGTGTPVRVSPLP